MISTLCEIHDFLSSFFRKLSDLELELKDKHESLVQLERREEKVSD